MQEELCALIIQETKSLDANRKNRIHKEDTSCMKKGKIVYFGSQIPSDISFTNLMLGHLN